MNLFKSYGKKYRKFLFSDVRLVEIQGVKNSIFEYLKRTKVSRRMVGDLTFLI